MDDLGRWMRRTLDQVAPPLDPRSVIAEMTPRRRQVWPVALASGALALALIGGGYWLLAGAPRPAASDASSTTTTTNGEVAATTVVESVPVTRLEPVRIDCTTELPGFPCGNLVDDDPLTEWRAPDGGIGAAITVYFSEPVTLLHFSVTNIPDEASFMRSARVRELSISTPSGATPIVSELLDRNDEVLWLGIGEPMVTQVTLEVVSGYPGQSFGDQEPYVELAIADLQFYGYVGESSHTDPETVTTAIDPSASEKAALLAALDGRLVDWLAEVRRLEADWEGRRATFADTQQGLLDLASSVTNDFVTIRADLEPLLSLDEVVDVLGPLANLSESVLLIHAGLNAPDDGTLRRAAVEVFEEEVAELRAAIGLVGSGATTAAPACSAEGISPELVPIPWLPEAVAEMRVEIAQAAAGCDIARLVELAMPGEPFVFAIGREGDPTAWWIGAERAGEEPLRRLVCLLQAEPAITPPLEDGSYWYRWPTASEVPWEQVGATEKAQLSACVGEATYLLAEIRAEYPGPRLGISDDGDWLFFVQGGN